MVGFILYCLLECYLLFLYLFFVTFFELSHAFVFGIGYFCFLELSVGMSGVFLLTFL